MANVSHELITPLNGIVGVHELLSESELDDEQRELLNLCQFSSQSMQKIITRAITLNEVQDGNIEINPVHYDVQSLLTELANTYSQLAHEKGLNFSLELDPKFPSNVILDPKYFSLILTQLLDNAIHFTDKGHIALRAYCHNDDLTQIRFEIEDTGLGIPDEHLQRIFSPFTQVDESNTRHKDGLGMGLALCFELAQMLNGQIDVKTEKNKGSCFTFALDVPTRRHSVSGTSILLVEPNPTARKTIYKILEKSNAQIFSTVEYKDMEDICISENIDWVFVSIELDERERVTQLLTRLKRRTEKDFKVVGLTPADISISRFKSLNLDEIIRKPVRREQFSTLLQL